MRKLYLPLLLFLGIILTNVLSAQTVTVTVPVDGLVGSLRYTVNNAVAGDTILFSALTNNGNVNVSQGEIIIDKPLTFIGNDTTRTNVQGKNSHIFRITSADTVTFIGINFINASDDTLGGVMQSDSTRLFFSKCSFNGNSAVETGGVLYLNESDTDIDSCSFSNNQAFGRIVKQGGGVLAAINSDVVVNGSSFFNNHADSLAGSGGAVLNLDGANFTFNGCHFEKNTASRAGGAIEGNSGAGTLIVLNDCTLDSNMTGSSPGNGGAVHITGAGDIQVDGGSFTGNMAASEGGALWNGAGNMVVTGASIVGNTASGVGADQGGGGIYNLSGTLTVNGGTIISSNIADGAAGSGGGILNDAGATLIVDSVYIVKNVSNRAGGGIEDNSGSSSTVTLTKVYLDSNITNTSPGNGGGFHITGAGNAVITGGTANGNSAGQEGGAFWNGSGTMTITGTLIDGNLALGDKTDDGGAGIFNNGGVLEVLDGTVLSNNISNGLLSSGGAILSLDSSVTITNATITNNGANRAGGAIEIIDGELSINNSSITGNDVNGLAGSAMPGNGGALHITGAATINISGGTIANNIAAREGGGLWNQKNSTMTVGGGVRISGNIALGDESHDGGGGVFNNGGILVLNDAVIEDNHANGIAGSGGGVLNVDGGTVTGTGVMIRKNSAKRAGGGIEDVANASLSLTNATIDSNITASSPGNGGGIHITGATNVTLLGGSVSGNTASSEGGGLWNGTGIMNLAGVTVANNTASGDASNQGGGGIYNLRGVVLTQSNTVIENNVADGASGSGGGVLNDSAATLIMSQTVVRGNIASRAGGGIEDNSGASTAVSLIDVTLEANSTGSTPGNGGGLHVTGAGNVEMKRGVVRDNIAAAEGGGLWNGSGAMVVDSVLIENNEAQGAAADQGGGGIYNLSGVLVVSNATQINDNRATGASGSGGGILNDVGGTLTVDSSSFSGNSANRAGGALEDNSGAGTVVQLNQVDMVSNTLGTAPGNGGAVHITGPGDVNYIGGLLQENSAVEGGALWNGAGNMLVEGVTFNQNTASGNDADQGGGAIYNLSGTVTVKNAEFNENTATGTSGSGGAILNDMGAQLSVDSSSFDGNTSNRAGGAIEDNSRSNGVITITNSTFTNNITGSAPGNGGAIHITSSGFMDISNCMFSENVAEREGGALWNGSGEMNVVLTTLTNNEANGLGVDDGGAGLFNNGGIVNISQSTIDHNVSLGSGGGLMNFADGELTVEVSTISQNESAQAAGIASYGQLRLTNSTVVLNVASGNGGGVVHASDKSALIKGSIVAKNQATAGVDVGVTSGATLQSGGFNIIGNDDANLFTALGTDIEGSPASPVDPKINDTLKLNNGVTMTHATWCQSPGVNTGDASDMSNDQRGLAVFKDIRDIGAYELQDSCLVDGVDNFTANSNDVSFEMYPNPLQGNEVFISLSNSVKVQEVSLVDLSGKVLLKTQPNKEQVRMFVQGVSPGVYLVKVKCTQGVGVQKLVIR